ncbi:MAG: outer membrane protein transport protein [Proteobacteria bacterium]|nr:outer membrane protein transport protein [Pseudomonadota bacterium]
MVTFERLYGLKILTAVVICLVLSLHLSASIGYSQQIQRVEIPSSPNPVGSGARALGMGGAFIAVCDDATAASWNPGGLIQLELPEISFVVASVSRKEDNRFKNNPEGDGEQSISLQNLNYFSLAYPFTAGGRNMIVSLNKQHLYDFNRIWRFPLNWSSGNLSLQRDVEYEQNGGLSALGLAYAVQITPDFSLGLTLNFWDSNLNDNGWTQVTTETGRGTLGAAPLAFPFNLNFQSRDAYTFDGFNFNLGMLWRITPRLTVGAVFKAPFTGSLRHETSFVSAITFPTFPASDSKSSTYRVQNEQLDMPMSYGIGFAYRFSDAFTMSLDVYRTEWGDFLLKDANGRETSPITGKLADESTIEPTHQVRLGAEYLIIRDKYTVPLRAGVFYDPSPAEGQPDSYYGFSLGTGLAIGRFIFDVAYQYRFGDDVGGSILKGLGFSQDIREHILYMSVIIHSQ